MTPTLAHILARATRCLRWTDRRLIWVESLLESRLGDIEIDRLRQACKESGENLGRFYHWKVEQLALISCMRGLSRDEFLRLVSAADCSDYRPLDESLADDGRGLVLAIPHHGHFVLSIIAAAERLRQNRRVSIFYESPAAQSSNAIFDAAHGCLFGEGGAVSIIHNTRAGLIQAIRELRAGQVVIIMPDVYRNQEETWQIPFCGGHRNAMLGTAVLSRRTGAKVVPMVSRVGASLFDFATQFGTLPTPVDPPSDPVTEVYSDYTVTAAIFASMEIAMLDQLYAWQYTRGHRRGVHQQHGSSPNLTELLELGELMLHDPRLQPSSTAAFSLTT